MTATKRMVPLTLTALILVTFSTLSPAQDFTIKHHRAGPNRIRCIDYRDGTLAIGTYEAGLVVVKDGRAMTFGKADGLPDDTISSVFLVDSCNMYICVAARDYLQKVSYRFLSARIDDSGLSAVELSPGGSDTYAAAADLGPDGALWVYGKEQSLLRFDGQSWRAFGVIGRALSTTDIDKIRVADGNRVYISSYSWCNPPNNLFKFDGESWTVESDMPNVLTLGIGEQGSIWCVGGEPAGLWCNEGEGWRLVSDDPVWAAEDTYDALEPGGQGGLWALGKESLIRWRNETAERIDTILGMPFVHGGSSPSRCLFTCGSQGPDSSFLIGTYGYGMLAHDGEDFSLTQVDSCPGNDCRPIGMDSDGAVWFGDLDTVLLGRLRDGIWQTIYVPRDSWYYAASCMMIDGTMLVQGRRTEHTVYAFEGDSITPYDTSLWLHTDPLPMVDQKGALWFDYHRFFRADFPIFSLIDGVLTRYSTDYFRDCYAFLYCVGPGNTKWFTTEYGFTTFDDVEWNHLLMGRDLPWSIVTKALNGQYIVQRGDGFFLLNSDGEGEKISDRRELYGWVMDADGTWWCNMAETSEAGEGLFAGSNLDDWRQITMEDGLTSPLVSRVLIDHNGDKWLSASKLSTAAGARSGLHQIIDGGAAQQKLDLSLERSRDDSFGVAATVVNADYLVRPVLLWVACDCNGTMLYYPDWGPTPRPVKMVLCGKSIETHELVHLNTGDLPPGDYTFYGAISLLGGIDCLIGPRDKKFSVITYHKD